MADGTATVSTLVLVVIVVRDVGEVLEDEIEGNVQLPEGDEPPEQDVGVEEGDDCGKSGAGMWYKGGDGDDNSPEWVDGEDASGDDKSCSDWDEEDREEEGRTAVKMYPACRRTKLRESRMVFRKRKWVLDSEWEGTVRRACTIYQPVILEVAREKLRGVECRRMKEKGRLYSMCYRSNLC